MEIERELQQSLSLAQVLDLTKPPVDDKTKPPVDDKTPESKDKATEKEIDPMLKALKIAQEAFDQEGEKGQPINEAYAKIVDGALRWALCFEF